MLTDRIGRQEVLLPINHNRCNFRKQQMHLGQISLVETAQGKKIPPFWKFLDIFIGGVVVAMVIAINSVIGGFSSVDLV